jgi:hypothetical protein
MNEGLGRREPAFAAGLYVNDTRKRDVFRRN